MHDPVLDVAEARSAIQRLLEDLGLRAFVFTVEPKELGWQLSIECASGEAWQTISLDVDPQELRASLLDSSVRERLRKRWSERLGGCERGAQPGPAPHER
jgi:hypothetical protein